MNNLETLSLNTMQPYAIAYPVPPGTANIHCNDNLEAVYRNMLARGYPVVKLRRLKRAHYDSVPTDFDADAYRALHLDLDERACSNAREHFVRFGMAEGRMYREDQTAEIPSSWLRNLLNSEVLAALCGQV